MASLDISQLRNVTSQAIRNAEKTNSRVYNVLGNNDDEAGSFSAIFDQAVQNINTTNAFLIACEVTFLSCEISSEAIKYYLRKI